ncbi:hypothetical protein LMXM_10_1227 [Leishmania mexicana MHOM/GT/2001/U1103]|uniref:Uncharacterized protein n=1 Tax=Leishmania mexicana (strain MHOM/GT/2001/U1103) TaxID=929439 RepID=E9AND5_LEIMU|nr:hypothetical protein LMXM_10_1227 [Leishmania mexicana MHOM/GT/2001/U1103]CBZ24444.1 hypothetical protein LMXM_10_1227 [Leishmania mexicana MHOM/GT/2001/U1103]
MVLRHYRWFPLELEPDYKDGYTCDHCHQDFLEAPFYHEEATGTDYCLECGNAAGYTPFSGLVASLLFSSQDNVLRDSDSNSIALFAYRVDSQNAGICFANGSNLVLHLQMNGNIRDAIFYTVKEGSIESKLRVSSTDLSRRFSWLGGGLLKPFDVEVQLHTLPVVPVPLDDFCVLAYDATDDLIEIRLNEAYSQLLDVRGGKEIVTRAEMPVCAFSSHETDGCSKSEATDLLRLLRSKAEALKRL